jgi:hypothetical protein
MKSALPLIYLVAMIFAFSLSTAQAQDVQPRDSRSSSQWISHQMNQPPPGTSDRNHISKDRLDEIQQLYLQAKKEMDAKSATNPKDKK